MNKQTEMIVAFIAVAWLAYEAGKKKTAQVQAAQQTAQVDPLAWLGSWANA